MPVKNVVFLSYSPIKTALEHLRVLGPLSHTEIQVINGIEGDKPNLNLVRSGDLVVFQRNFSSRYQAYQSVMNEAHKHGIPVVMDLDDYLIGLPPDHPDRKWSPFAFELPALLHAMMNVDAITVTTPVLKSVVDQYNNNVFVLPNYLDDSIWSFKPKSKKEKQSLVRIAFVGTQSHQPDVEKIAKPLSKIAEKYKQRVSFLFYGMEIPEMLKDLENIEHRASVTYDYADFALDVRSISADIAIAPLNNTLFNRCKSPIKYMEYTAMGLPCVFSRTVPYSEIIEDGVNGFLAEKPNEWIEKISKLIDDQILRKQLLVNAQHDVRTNWMLHDHANLWQACYDQVLEQGVRDKPEISAGLTALGQIAEQIEEQLLKQAEKTALLNQVVHVTQAENASLKDTVLREEVRAADLLLAEKAHSNNLLAERNLFKEESDRKTTWLEDLNARIAELETRNNSLQEQISCEVLQLNQEKQELAESLEEYQTERQNLALAKEELQREKQGFQDRIDRLLQEKQGIVESLEQLQREKQDYQESLESLTQEKQSLKNSLEQLQSEHQEFRESIIDLTRENQSLVDALEHSQREKQEYQQNIDGLTQEKQWFVDTLVQLRKENQNYKKLNQQLDLQKSITQEEVSRLEGEVEDLRKNLEVKSLESKNIHAELDKLNQSTMSIRVQNDGKSNRIAELEEENKRLSTDLENTKREVVDYVMSDSWKITKPLRRIARFFKREKPGSFKREKE